VLWNAQRRIGAGGTIYELAGAVPGAPGQGRDAPPPLQKMPAMGRRRSASEKGLAKIRSRKRMAKVRSRPVLVAGKKDTMENPDSFICQIS